MRVRFQLLFSGLQGEEAFYRPPYHGLRHPLVFYYVHPATFYTNKFRIAGLIDAPINPYYEEVGDTCVFVSQRRISWGCSVWVVADHD